MFNLIVNTISKDNLGIIWPLTLFEENDTYEVWPLTIISDL